MEVRVKVRDVGDVDVEVEVRAGQVCSGGRDLQYQGRAGLGRRHQMWRVKSGGWEW